MLRLLLYFMVLAAVTYVMFWAIARRDAGPGTEPPTQPRPRGPLGPDDDEDFLRELDRKRKHRPDDPT